MIKNDQKGAKSDKNHQNIQKTSSNYATLESLEDFEVEVLKLVDTVEMFDLEEE